jgi:hypothetical protein
MLDEIFDRTVDTLEYISKKTGISYKKVNVLGMFGWLGLTAYLVYKSFWKS